MSNGIINNSIIIMDIIIYNVSIISIIIDIIMLRLSFNKVHFFAGFKNILKRAEASAFCPK